MKKIFVLFCALFLVGCGTNSDSNEAVFSQADAVAFDLVEYEPIVAAIYGGLAPYIQYAQTEGQFEILKERFNLGENDFTVDMEKYDVAFVTSYSSSCGLALDGVYNDEGKMIVQLLEPAGENCEPTQEPHTFVIATEKANYTKAQLYIGNVIKASVEVK